MQRTSTKRTRMPGSRCSNESRASNKRMRQNVSENLEIFCSHAGFLIFLFLVYICRFGTSPSFLGRFSKNSNLKSLWIQKKINQKQPPFGCLWNRAKECGISTTVPSTTVPSTGLFSRRISIKSRFFSGFVRCPFVWSIPTSNLS